MQAEAGRQMQQRRSRPRRPPAAGRRRARRPAGRRARTPFACAFRRAASMAVTSWSSASTGAKPSFAGRDGEHARAAADVDEAARLELAQQLETETRRRWPPVPNARPGSITTATTSSGGSSQGGPIQTRPIAHRPVKVAPALLPAGVDFVGGDGAESRPEALFAARVGVGRELDAVRQVPPPRSLPGRARSSAPARSLRAPARRPSRRGAARSAERALQLLEEPLVDRRSVSSPSLCCSSSSSAPLLVGQPARHPRR